MEVLRPPLVLNLKWLSVVRRCGCSLSLSLYKSNCLFVHTHMHV